VEYSRPAVEHQEPIGAPFVVGTPYNPSPTWTGEEQEQSG
jgi:hypothetical protein